MSRTDAQEYRKTQRMIEQTHGGNAGASIIERLEVQLDVAMARWMGEDDAVKKATARGEVRGLARAVGMMKSPYRPVSGLKQAEKDSAARVRSARGANEADDAE